MKSHSFDPFTTIVMLGAAAGVVTLFVSIRSQRTDLEICVAERDVATATLETTRANLLDTQAELLIGKADWDQMYDELGAAWDEVELLGRDFREMCDADIQEIWDGEVYSPDDCFEEMEVLWDMRCRGDYAGIQAMLTCEDEQ